MQTQQIFAWELLYQCIVKGSTQKCQEKTKNEEITDQDISDEETY
jgi:hypothetical protein